jgi:hypothetical protein
MKTTNLIIGHAFFVVIGMSAVAQGTFQNLNFELANPVFVNSFTVTTASALPFWSAAVGGVQQTDIGYNFFQRGLRPCR